MKKDKDGRDKDVEKPQESSGHGKSSMSDASGVADSRGGSRQGNIGHQGNSNRGKGHRQV